MTTRNQCPSLEELLKATARAAQFLAIWRVADTGATQETTNTAELKRATAMAHHEFLRAAYEVAFILAPYLIMPDAREVATRTEVRYSAPPSDGGMIIQKMDMDPSNPGVRLDPGEVSTENFLQLIIDLPEILEQLGII